MLAEWLERSEAAGLRSKADPVASGDQRNFVAPMAVAPAEPCTISMAASRTFPAAAVFATAPAGTIASRNGSAMVTPTPLRAVRREMCFCVMNMSAPGVLSWGPEVLRLCGGYRAASVVVSAASSRPIWNAGLFTTPRMNCDMR